MLSPKERCLVIGHLYPDLLGLYGDRGNILCLLQRAQWRDIAVELKEICMPDHLSPDGCDLFFIGGGQDREQRLVAEDLQGGKGHALREAVADGRTVLAVCGGYQLLGHYYRPATGSELPGIGIFDVWTEHPGGQGDRCIGDLLVQWSEGLLVGFENHGGRTYLGNNCSPLGKVIAGRGNNGRDGTEGAIYLNAYGSYLHGSFLPKNPRFADHLLSLALARKYGDGALQPLDDRLEEQARAAAISRARKRNYWKLL